MPSLVYAGFFLAIAAASFGGLLVSDSVLRWALCWPMLNGLTLAAAYALNRPSLLLGKTRTGGWSLARTVLNLPWLIVTWMAFHAWRLSTTEHAHDQIGETNIWIGRRPSADEAASFDLIVDLTAEFPRVRSEQIECVPNLDGAPLANLDIFRLPSDARVLVHCAQGHGRSATWLALQLVHNEHSPDVTSALKLIAAARPAAKPSRAQTRDLHNRHDHDQA